MYSGAFESNSEENLKTPREVRKSLEAELAVILVRKETRYSEYVQIFGKLQSYCWIELKRIRLEEVTR